MNIGSLTIHKAPREDSDQTAHMRNVICRLQAHMSEGKFHHGAVQIMTKLEMPGCKTLCPNFTLARTKWQS